MRHSKATALYRASGIGRKHTVGDHYADGYRNGAARVAAEPRLVEWYAAMAWGACRSAYADWPPYRAYQLGFARAARSARPEHSPLCHKTVCHMSCPVG